MKHIVLKVLVPAKMQNSAVGVISDPTPSYMAISLANGMRPPTLGAAVVTGGTKVGNKWLGCTYTKTPFDIPGYGEVEEV